MQSKNLPKHLFFLPLFFLISLISKGQLLSESFDGSTFPPAGWTNIHTTGTSTDAVWEQAAAAAVGGDGPAPDFNAFTVDPHSGAGMATFNSYLITDGNGATLISPSIDLSSITAPQLISFWMYREDGYSTKFDSVSIYINTVPDIANASFLGRINRAIMQSPVESGGNGWYKYTFPIPASFNGASNYIIFNAVSRFGNNIFIDDVTVANNLACSGTPSAGVISGPSSICSGANFNLINAGATQGFGMHYSWQSAANAGGPWTNITGQTNYNQATITQTTATYYRFVDTCTSSNASAISNVIQVTLNPITQCYCQPPAVILHNSVNDFISNITIQGTTLNSSNATNATTGYTLIMPNTANNTANLSQLTNYTIVATLGGTIAPTQVSGWLDFNGNGTFDAAEFFDMAISGTTATGSIAIPSGSIIGQTGMRIRGRTVVFSNTDACTSFFSGETEDYTVSILSNAALNAAIVDVITPDEGCNAGNIVTVKLRNSGAQNISAGAATVALYTYGANTQGPLTLSNTTLLLPGDTATLNFTCSFPVGGFNTDSVFIQSLAGDSFHADDSIVTGHIRLPAAVNAPYAEDFEGNVPGWTVRQLAGSGNWGTSSTVNYPDYSPAYTLNPKSGNGLALFNSYSFDTATVSRLASNCINIPANANSGCGYIAGFYFTQDAQYNNADSIVVRISDDGGNSFTRLGKVKRQDSSLATSLSQQDVSIPEWKLYTFNIGSYAGKTVQFAFDAYGWFGNSMAIDSFFVGPKAVAGNIALAGSQETGASLAPASTPCTDASGWTYYTDGNSARYLFGIQWDPANTGANAVAKAQATAKLTIDRKWFAAEDGATQKATYTMQRYWDVNLGGASLTTPVNIRFFYSQREFDSIITAKNNFIAAHPGSRDEGFAWFKTITGPFIPSTTSVTPDAVVNAITLTNTNTTGATINGILYAQFEGVSSFSGGTAASGVGPSTPVPVDLFGFNAQRTGRVNKLTWSTSLEINTSRFVIERSTDGRNYSPIGQVTAAGNSNSTINYSFVDNAPGRGINYYRLRILDIDTRGKLSVVRTVRNEGTADVAIYPNPVRDNIRVNITSDKADMAKLTVADISGKLVYTTSVSIAEGPNNLSVPVSSFAKGAYIIKVQLSEDMVVRKFNKL